MKVRLVQLSPDAMRFLEAGDLAAANRAAGVPLSEFLAGEECRWVWRIFVEKIEKDPEYANWVVRAVVTDPGGVAVGHAGFHGPPDGDGVVEVGYTVDPAFRRQGYAKAIIRALLARAADDPQVTRVRASISPDNIASLASIRGFGFVKVGEEWDENDGLEIVFETPARHAGS